ncbi:MAG: glycosyltransferase family 39 protein, partial [Holophagales bacterium]|nr:glycosyltransferase family 39 protein [Holophagales bacterium]
LIAVAVLATSPWFLQACSKFKPDASLLATTLLALWLSSRAAERPFTWGGYAAAGAAIAAAMSCKLTGGLSAVPLALVSLAQARAEVRRLLGLAVAGVTSLVLFLVANPDLGLYLHFMGRLSAEYEDKAKAYGGTHLGVARRSLEMVVSELGLGSIFGGAALLGFLLLGLSAFRRGSPLRRPAPALVWLFPPVFLTAFAASTPHFKGNNVLSILPPLALFAGWTSVAAWRLLSPRLELLRPSPRLPILAAAVLAAALHLGSGAWTYVYESVVPSTHDLARNWLRAELGRLPLHVIREEAPAETYRWEGAALASGRVVAWFPWIDHEIARDPPVADGILGSGKDVEASPWATLSDAIGARIGPAPWAARGPAVEVRARPWRRRGKPVQPEAEQGGGRLHLAWPEALGGGWYSVEVWVPQRAIGGLDPYLEIAGHRRPLAWLRTAGQGHLFTSPRFRFDPRLEPPSLSLEIPRIGPEGVAFALYRWQPPWHGRATRGVGSGDPVSGSGGI